MAGSYRVNQRNWSPELKVALAGLKDIESWYDVPFTVKLTYLNMAVDRHPELGAEAERTAARLKRFHDHPKYEVFYEVQPLLDWLKGLDYPATLTLEVLTRATIVALRITTLMRSGDLHNMVSHVYIHSDQYFVCAKNKKGTLVTARVDGITKDLVLEYLFCHRNHPAALFFRNQNNPALCISSERIAKHRLIVMEAVGVNTHVFKSHSIRGATTTFLFSLGVDKQLVQARVQWSSEICMGRYYSLLHSHIPWDQVLHTHIIPGLQSVVGQRGQPLDEACPLGAALGPEVPWKPQPRAEPTGRGEGNETQAAHQEELSALWLCHSIFDTPSCARCKVRIGREAGYRCIGCSNEFHVRRPPEVS